MSIHVLRLADGPSVTGTAARWLAADGIESRTKILSSSFKLSRPCAAKASSPQSIGVIGGGRLAGLVTLPEVVDRVRRGGDRDGRRSYGS
jgi:hypothetical protein